MGIKEAIAKVVEKASPEELLGLIVGALAVGTGCIAGLMYVLSKLFMG